MPPVVARLGLVFLLQILASSVGHAAPIYSGIDFLPGLKAVVANYVEFMVSKHQTELLCIKPTDRAASVQYWEAARKNVVSEILARGFDSATAKRIDARLEQGGKTDAGAQCPPDLQKAFADSKWGAYDWGRDVHDTFEGVSFGLELKPERSQLKPRTLDQLDQIEAAVHKESDKRIMIFRCVQAMMPHSVPYVWSVEIGQNIRILAMMKNAGFPDEDLQQVADMLDFKAFMAFLTPDELAAHVDDCKKTNDWRTDVNEFKFDPLEQAVRAVLYDVPKQ